jgi:hypothetical protein
MQQKPGNEVKNPLTIKDPLRSGNKNQTEPNEKKETK